ncbi:MAG: tetratricopeptide repeat protein [Clostridia bacterium]|nr:tetratricopeptide repeat protein [Clostridia bacterium]
MFPMLALYPKRLRQFILLSVALTVLIIAILLFNRSANPGVWIVLGVIGIAGLLVSCSGSAMKEHQAETARLYDGLDAEGFIRDYSVHLGQKMPSQDTALMVRMHLSNAYASLGRFDEAERVLLEMPRKEKKKEESNLFTSFAITSNLCYCAEQKGDTEKAQKYLDELLSLRKRLEELQLSKPQSKRLTFNTELNEQCMRYLKEGKADSEALKELVKGSRQQLPKITTSLWLARAYLADGNREEAEKLLRRIVELAPALYPGKTAAKLLGELDAKQ